MTIRLDQTIQQFAEFGVALPAFTIFLFDLPRYAYVLLIACLAVGLVLNQYSNSSPSTKLTVNLFLATVSIMAALLMWRGTSLLFMGGIRGLSASG
jgi:hypothetical protein